jgi:outer membrane protein assembly factor BamB
MTRHLVLVLFAALAASLCPSERSSAAPLISRSAAARHGMVRAWYTQVRIDPGRARVTHLTLSEGNAENKEIPDALFVQTDRAMVHAIDAETGKTLWVKLVGRPDHPGVPIGVNKDLVAVVNGSYIYALDRVDGKILWKRSLDGVPAAGIAMSRRRVFVPMLTGQVFAYRLKQLETPLDEELDMVTKRQQREEEEDFAEEPAPTIPETTTPETKPGARRESIRLEQRLIPPSVCQSFGRITSQPIIVLDDDAKEIVAWTTTKGLFVARVAVRGDTSFVVKYQLSTDSPFVAQPTFLAADPKIADRVCMIFSASKDGTIHARQEHQGNELWKLAVGQPIIEPIAPIGEKLYAATQLGGMYCVRVKDGRKLWWTPQIVQFVAASEKRVYAADRLGRLLVLDAQSGARLDTMAVPGLRLKLLNMQTDRIYLGTETGLIQCLHEVELTEPIRHRQSIQKPVDQPEEGETPKPDEPLPPAGSDPFS